MTLEEFNDKEFKALDRVRVLFYDGAERIITLHRGEAYAGYSAQDAYTGGPGRSEKNDEILVFNPAGQPSSIDLTLVRDVIYA